VQPLNGFIVLFQDTTSPAAKNFLAAANAIDNYPFGITSADSVFSEYSVDGEAVILFKKVK
jgi:protein disulfide-isomerase A1